VKIYQASLACFYSLRFNDNSETAVAYFFRPYTLYCPQACCTGLTLGAASL